MDGRADEKIRKKIQQKNKNQPKNKKHNEIGFLKKKLTKFWPTDGPFAIPSDHEKNIMK